MTGIKIENNVPLPDTVRKGVKYPLSEMTVGDSFKIGCKSSDESKKKVNALYQNSRNYVVKNGLKWRFAARVVDGGARLWRVA